ncbi:unnamed protein product [Orchesella dallaii]|uniref:Constitutive coactivator of PPAR-gamma-like protein 1 n=1 Tax=Orchesella dallaii TaxID=48710 RepID=A0ABP1Q902_9HEXA
MGLSDLQSHITQNIPNAVEQVDLLKLAQARTKKGEGPLKLVVDGECCLDRLYGGYYPDWVCGGQWNKMEQFLRNLSTVVQGSNLDLVIFFNGCLEPERLDTEWKKRQEETYRFLEEIQKHVTLKKKPPPKIWWVPPAFLRSAIRLAFRTLHMKMMCSVEDHHKDVVRFCQRNSFHGIIADDPEYLVFDIHDYFSAQKLKLTFKGSLETVQVKLQKVFATLELPKDRFFIFAALLGNHLLSENDLKEFFSSLQVDTSTKASVIEKVAQFTQKLEVTEPEKVGEVVANLETDSGTDKEKLKELADKVVKCLRYYLDVNNTKGNSTQRSKDKKKNTKKEVKDKKSPNLPQATVTTSSNEGAILPSDTQKLEGDVSKVFAEASAETDIVTVNGNGTGNGTVEAVNNTSGKMSSTLDKLLYRINPEIENVAISRHKSGLMSPYICQILKNKEVKLPALIEDVKNNELPKAHDLFRPLRQQVYAILFNLHHLQFLAKQRNEKAPTIQVKETLYCPMLKSNKTQFVNAVEIGWGVPTVERLWLGDQEECKRKRIRAFLTIMKSDKAIILDSTCVPQQMLVLTCVLRYILGSEKKVVRKCELEAYIAQAFIQDMTDPTIAQDIEVTNLSMRGIHLSHLFMEGCEMALLANDACGAPIPYMLFCPWLFFNGKVFNYILEQQSLGKTLAEICGFKMDLVFNIDQLKMAILDGIKVQFVAPVATPFLYAGNAPLMNQALHPGLNYVHPQYAAGPARSVAPLQQLAAAAAATAGGGRNRLIGATSAIHGGGNPFGLNTTNVNAAYANLYGNAGYPAAGSLIGLQNRAAGAMPLIPDLPNRQRRVQQRGGHLEVAGMIVGSWGANYGPNGNLTNSLAAQGRNVRVPMTPGAFANPNLQMSLFDQMRISGPNKVPNRSGGQGGQWNKKTPGKNQKSIIRKGGENNTKTANGTNGSISTTNGQSTSSAKSKGVTFKEEGEATSNRTEIGPSEDVMSSSVGDGEMNDSSLADVANEAQVKVEG